MWSGWSDHTEYTLCVSCRRANPAGLLCDSEVTFGPIFALARARARARLEGE